MTVDQDAHVQERDMWAGVVRFVITLGLHIGVVLFASLSLALMLYAITAGFDEMTQGQVWLLWPLAAVSLAALGVLLKQEVRGFRTHVIRGLGSLLVSSSGYSVSEVGADISCTLLGLAQFVPLVTAWLNSDEVPRSMWLSVLVGGTLLVLTGAISLSVRVWLHCRRARDAQAGKTLANSSESE